jgi:CDP-diacylglycerol--glycerol-3-phosphate 3-phosphatidyltransferase
MVYAQCARDNGAIFMTTANKVTIARMIFVPLFVAQIIAYVNGGNQWHRLAAIACFGIAALGDALDGYIARRCHQQTELGAILDPLADKLLLVSALVILSVDTGPRFARIPWWLAAIVVTRELILLAGMVAIRCAWGRFTARPRLPGKLATVLQMAVVLWILLQFPAAPLPFLTAGAGLFTFLSGLLYLCDFTGQWRGGGVGLKIEPGAEVQIRRG